MAEDPIEQSERHIREGERRVAEQEQRLKAMEQQRGNPDELVARAREVRDALPQTLRTARDRLQNQRKE